MIKYHQRFLEISVNSEVDSGALFTSRIHWKKSDNWNNRLPQVVIGKRAEVAGRVPCRAGCANGSASSELQNR